MKWIIRPSTLSGSIAIPPSKSHTIRAILVASLAQGTSTIRNPLLHGDGRSAVGVAESLGAKTRVTAGILTVTSPGIAGGHGVDNVFTGNSGTSTNLFTSAAALSSRARTFDGDASIRSRPVRPLLDALTGLGATYRVLPDARKDVPFEIRGPLVGGTTRVNGVSSQFVSSLLLSCPLAPGSTTIYVENLQERPYVELTLWWLDKMGIVYKAAPDLSRFDIPGNQRYRPIDLSVPADFSSAAFSAVAAAVTRSNLRLTGLDFTDPQGDKGIFAVLEQLGASVKRDRGAVDVNAIGQLTGAEIDLNAMPDALPILAVAGCAAAGTTRIVNVAHARIKETDRITVMTQELRKMGAHVEELPDGMVVRHSFLTGAHVNGHDDHRVVMALAVAALSATGETTVTSAEAAEVTYPTFVEDFRRLGAQIEVVAD
jgi:3-phosphoshikimate 1-carboxyvinyltransferase